METKFQTSFIPKTSLDQPVLPRKGSLSFFLFISVIIFIVSIAAAGGAYAWKKHLVQSIEVLDKALSKDEQALRYEKDSLEDFYRLEARLDSAKRLLDEHISFRSIFEFLSRETLKSVRFTSFSFSVGSDGKGILELEGLANTYNALANQSGQFGKETRLTDQVFSNIDLDKSGKVVFKFSAKVNKEMFLYKNNIPKNGESFYPEENVSVPDENPEPVPTDDPLAEPLE